MVSGQTFVAVFPEFADISVFPAAQIEFWLGQAPNQLSEKRFGPSFDLACMLFVAHNLVLSSRDRRAKNSGGVSGGAGGVQSSKTVDKVSVTYDTGAVTIPGAGAWNATTYGQRLYKMMQAAHSGPVYVANRRSRIT